MLGGIVVGLFAFLITLFSGVVLWLKNIFIPRGHSVFLGLVKHEWINLHIYLGLFFSFIVLIHLILKFRWIIAVTKNLLRK